MLTRRKKNKALSLLLSVVLVLSVFLVLGVSTVGAVDAKTLYLKPNANWLKSDARFAMYVTGKSGSEWVSMTSAEDGYYSADVPAGDYTAVVFARMNPATPENKTANRWNYSKEMTIPTDGTNSFTVDAGQWSNATGEWGVYIPKSSLKKLYLKPNNNWIKSDARFAMYVTGKAGSEWVSMEDAGDGYYTAYVPANGYTTVTFARMNPATTENKPTNRWNYSAEMTIPTDKNNCFTIDAGQWSNATGVWAEFVPTVYDVNTLYLKPNSNWIRSNARFAMYLDGGSSATTWVSMTNLENGYYKADIPEGDYTKVTFIRMDPNKPENVWGNLWNDSAAFDIPTNGTNCFEVAEGQWSSANGTWGNYSELNTLYFKPSNNWINSHARFAMYLFAGDKPATWVSMTETEAYDGYYSAEIPEGDYTKVIFARMNPGATVNSWEALWNDALEQKIPAQNTNCFTVDEGQWSSATGKWSVYAPTEEPTEFTERKVTVREGNVVNVWVEVSIPEDGVDVAGWDLNMYYDSDMFTVNDKFADGYGFAAGNEAIDYALGLSEKEASLPGGSLVQASFNEGRVKLADIDARGLKLNGKNTKLVCIQLTAIANGRTTLAYEMSDIVDVNLQDTYIDKADNNKPAGGAEYKINCSVIR